MVAATANGSPKHPGWFHNLVRNAEVQVEAGGKAFKARATVADEPERLRLWNDHVAGHPEFAGYPRADRAHHPTLIIPELVAPA